MNISGNMSLVITICLCMLVACGLYLFVNNKFKEQDHKMASMLSIVSTLAEEVKRKDPPVAPMNGQFERQCYDNICPINGDDNDDVKHIQLIEVSDGEEDEETYVSEEEDEEDMDMDDEEDEEEVIDLKDEGDMSSESSVVDVEDEDEYSISAEPLDINEVEIQPDEMEVAVETQPAEIKTVHIDLTSEIDNVTELIDNEEHNAEVEIESEPLENIVAQDTTMGGEPNYKSMSLGKLRHIVVEKKLVSDASKLKKNELLKLLKAE